MDDENRHISLRGISKGFSVGENRYDVLKNVDFDVEKSGTIAIVGASGIGKSTLLHIIGTLDRPDSGSLFFDGMNVFRVSDRELASFRNEKIGFVFQFHHLLPEFTAIENVAMPLWIKGYKKEEAFGESEVILKRVGLGERLMNRAGELSGGEQQRVAIARAIVQKPSILLADEPTGNLDRRNSEQIHELLGELNREFRMTMIVVTHNLALAACMQKQVTIVEGNVRTCIHGAVTEYN
jgi:lipoprotein-releasing system ATP-binding protein